jgi:hypothetical protein
MKVQMKGFIMASKSQRYDVDKHAYVDHMIYTFCHYDSSKYDAEEVVVGEHAFEVEVPDNFDLRAGLVANLEREKQKVTAEFQARVTEINGQIQSLMALEGPVSEVVS